MGGTSYDIVVVGGGIAGSCIAKAMAERGARVLILERETVFKDRVRGEALLPWGVAEMRELGVYDLLRETCAHEQRWLDIYLGPNQLMHRDLVSTTPQGQPMLTFYHPQMQEVLIGAAAKAGAEVRRGAIVTALRSGSEPAVTFNHEGTETEVQARLVVAADGRVSMARKSAGFVVEHDPPSLFLAGVLFEEVPMPQDTGYIMTNPMLYQGAFMFPQGAGRARAYFAYPVNAGYRLQGPSDIPRFIDEAVKAGAPAEYYTGRPCGPLASFETADTWVPHPHRNRVVLVGDAAASTDPSWGTGLSCSLRDVRVLRDRLVANDNWDQAADEYAEEHDRAHDVIHKVTSWNRQIFMENGPEAEVRRARAMPLIAEDPTRVPDHGMSGPDLPFDKVVTKARFFGEDAVGATATI